MRTPSDLARIDEKLVRFWDRYGALVYFALAVLGFCIGYSCGASTK